MIRNSNMNDLVLKWAEERGILKPENAPRQMLKLIEEVGELAGAMAKNKFGDIVDAIGDIQVVLIILSKQLGYDYEQCLVDAYNVIKERKGKTINGIFVKD
jgi:NTP pyrophosphatase (non-canonical NTP hydrolase)